MRKQKRKVYLRKDGRYELRYAYGLKKDGTTNYRSVYGETEEEVLEKAKVEKKKMDLKNDLLILDKSFFGSDIYKWLNSTKIRCKKSTYSNYQYTVNARIVPRFAKVKKKNITAELINSYTSELLEEGLLPKTVKDILIILQQILRFAGIDINISMPKVPKNEIQIFSRDEQTNLEKVLLESLNLTTFGIYLCLYTGLRIGELCALKWENIDLENKRITIKKTITRIKNPDNNSRKRTIVVTEEPKSSCSIREIPIPDFIISLFEKICVDRSPSSFLITGTDKFVETRTYFNRYKKILRNIKLDDYNFHALRHTFATRCVENGCDPKTLSEILGHSSVKITLERYVHPNYENKVRMMNQLKPMYN